MDGKRWPDSCLEIGGNGLGLSRSLSLQKNAICYCKKSTAWPAMRAIIDNIGSGMSISISETSHHFTVSGALDRSCEISNLRSLFLEDGHLNL
jgi:hypothetical protein